MKSKHTPGPWKLKGKSISYYIEGNASRNPKWKAIPKTPSNLTLVAAAPEMLEALNVAYMKMEHRKGDCYSDDYMGVCCCGKDVVKAAIDKAEGKISID